MALTVGDGPNRGKSTPSPRPLPKPEQDRPRNVADAISRGSYQVSFSNKPTRLGPPIGFEFLRRDPGVVHPPALAPRSKDAVKAYNRRLQAPAMHRAQRSRVEDMYNNMAARQITADKRAAREKADREENEKPLTAAEWVKLTPLQQSAAQANADLMAAVAKDFKDQGKHTANSSQKEGGTERVQKYMKGVESLFGENSTVGYKGLEFAPNTLAFLESRGLDAEDLKGKTLDDFTSGDALIDDDTFEALAKPTANDSRARNVEFAKTLAQGQLRYQEQLAAQLQRGDQLLTDLTGRGTNARAGEQYGAKLLPERQKLTAVRPEMVGQIDKYMEALARTDIPLNQALDTINMDLSEAGVSKTEAAQIWENMIERSRRATTGEVQWFDDVDFEMRSPLEVAQALGAPALKREGAK